MLFERLVAAAFLVLQASTALGCRPRDPGVSEGDIGVAEAAMRATVTAVLDVTCADLRTAGARSAFFRCEARLAVDPTFVYNGTTMEDAPRELVLPFFTNGYGGHPDDVFAARVAKGLETDVFLFAYWGTLSPPLRAPDNVALQPGSWIVQDGLCTTRRLWPANDRAVHEAVARGLLWPSDGQDPAGALPNPEADPEPAWRSGLY